MNLKRVLTKEVITVGLEGNTKEEIIDSLVSLLEKGGKISDVDKVRNCILERESKMSTGMEAGIAIPHGKTDAVKELVACIGIKKEGVDFKALDGQPSSIFIMTVSPLNKTGPHVQFLAEISRVLREAPLRTKLLEAGSAEEILFSDLQVVMTHLMTKLVLQLALIIILARLLGWFFPRFLKLPKVLGELVSGMIIGPYALGSLNIAVLHGPLFHIPPGGELCRHSRTLRLRNRRVDRATVFLGPRDGSADLHKIFGKGFDSRPRRSHRVLRLRRSAHGTPPPECSFRHGSGGAFSRHPVDGDIRRNYGQDSQREEEDVLPRGGHHSRRGGSR